MYNNYIIVFVLIIKLKWTRDSHWNWNSCSPNYFEIEDLTAYPSRSMFKLLRRIGPSESSVLDFRVKPCNSTSTKVSAAVSALRRAFALVARSLTSLHSIRRSRFSGFIEFSQRAAQHPLQSLGSSAIHLCNW